MSKSISTFLLAAAALVMVGAGAFLIVTTAMNDGETSPDSSAAATVSEQHVYLMNLGMG